MPATLCPQCGEPLDSSSLDGLCPRCIALDFLGGESDVMDRPAAGGASGFRLGDFELISEIARGGMGVVYRARQISLGREVAVKTILSGLLAGDEAIARFKTEAAAAAGLRHPHIVAIYEIGEEDGQHFFSMEYVEGKPLSALLRERPLPARQAAELLEKIAGAVAYAHERGVVHRDLKPSNVLVDGKGEPRVMDFGLAKRLDTLGDLTLSGQVLGTPGYLAPEQASGQSRQASPAADIYGLGAILYHLLTGRAPFIGENALAVLRQVERDDPLSLRALTPGIPVELEAVCMKCLAREPMRRYASASEVAEEMGRFLDGRPVLAKPAGRLEKVARWVRRNRGAASAAATIFLLLASVAAVSTISARRLTVARDNEASERARAEAGQRELRRTLYATGLRVVQQLHAEGALGNVADWVEKQNPAPGEEDLRTFEWRVVRAWTRGEQEALAELSPPTEAGALSPCGRFATSWDVEAERTTLRDLRTGREITSWDDPARQFGNRRHLDSTPEGRWVVATSLNGIRLWDASSGDVRLLSDSPVEGAAFSPDGRWLAVSAFTPQGGENPRAVVFYDTATWREAGKIPGRIPGFAWQGETLRVVNLAAGSLEWWTPNASEAERKVALVPTPRMWATPTFSANGGRVAVVRDTEHLAVYDTANGALVAEVSGAFSVITLPVLSPDGRWLARGGAEEEIRFYDLASPSAPPRLLRGHRSRIHSLRFTADGNRIVSWSADGTLRTWSLEAPEQRGLLTTKSAAAASIAPIFSPDGRWLAYADQFDSASFERPAHSVICEAKGSRVLAQCDALPLGASADGRALLGLRGGRFVVRLDAATGAETRAVALPEVVQARLPRVSPDGRYVAWWSGWDRGAIHDLAAGERVHEFAAGTTDAQFSPDGKQVALMTAKLGLRVLDLATWTERALPLAVPSMLAWSRDSRRLAFISSSNPPTLSVLEVATMSVVGKLTGQGLPNMRFAFSGDGKTLVSNTRDGTLRFWNLLTWSRTLVLPPQGPIGSFAFTPSDEALLVGRSAGFTGIEAPHALPVER